MPPWLWQEVVPGKHPSPSIEPTQVMPCSRGTARCQTAIATGPSLQATPDTLASAGSATRTPRLLISRTSCGTRATSTSASRTSRILTKARQRRRKRFSRTISLPPESSGVTSASTTRMTTLHLSLETGRGAPPTVATTTSKLPMPARACGKWQLRLARLLRRAKPQPTARLDPRAFYRI